MPVTRIQASMSYSPASLYAGLPLDLVPQVETVLDNRLAYVAITALVRVLRIRFRVIKQRRECCINHFSLQADTQVYHS